jgi:pyruvate ferredoxin oxidoreductase gamma subunit
MILRIRFHGRGGQGGKTASRILGSAAYLSGFTVQDSPVYGPERRGAPVTAFTRISDQEILERGYLSDPDIIVIMDETLLADERVRPLEGVREHGIVFVNTPARPEAIRLDRKDITITTMDLTGRSIDMLGHPIVSSASGAVAAKLISLVSEDALAQAVSEELLDLRLRQELIEKNIRLALDVYREVEAHEVHTEERATERRLVPLESILQSPGYENILSVGNSKLRQTGDWRTFKPTIDYIKCTECMICFDYCPESAIEIANDGKPLIDYDNCKGCLICYRECPPRAITIEREARAS